MAVTPIRGRCRRCRRDFYLFELVNRRSGLCPRCGRNLTPNGSEVLLDTTVRADAAQRALIAALYRLNDLPGSLVLRPHSVVRNLLEEVGWERGLAGDPELLAEELNQLRQLVSEPAMLVPDAAAESARARREQLGGGSRDVTWRSRHRSSMTGGGRQAGRREAGEG